MNEFLAQNGLVVAIAALVLVVVAILVFVASRLRTVPPDEALIVVSMGKGKADDGGTLADPSKYAIHTAGRVFVVPVLQDAFPLSLKQRQVEIQAVGPDKNFVPTQAEGNLSFKFSDRPEEVVKAAQRFRGHTDEQLSHSIQQAVEGSLRSIIASMTFGEINSDRVAFQQHVLESAKAELAEQGISVDVLNIRGISTPGSSYSEDLAKAELAAARRNAQVAEAKAAQESEFAKIQAAEQVAQRQRDLALKQAEFKGETDRADAEAQAAGNLARAEQDARVADLERAALTQRALVAQEQLDIDQKKPADAAAYATRVKAEGEREAAKARAEADAYQRKVQAEAEAYQRKLQAEAEAAAQLALAKAQAEAARLKGEAEAQIARQVGEAEAAATSAKADALAQYGHDALVYELVTRLPQIMEANAKAVAGIGEYTVIGTQGAADAVAQATSIGAQTIGAVKSLTGVDLSGVASRIAGTDAEATRGSTSQPEACSDPAAS